MPTGSEIPASHATLYRLALASIGIGVLVLGFKFLAWRLTGSVALYSDALESIINVATAIRSEENTSELQSLIRISYAVFCLKKTKNNYQYRYHEITAQT